jgi:dTDP-4-dehydrorhamnose 3,5-epimerase-like enzyme
MGAQIDPSACVHDQALLLGDVVLEEGVAVGAGAVVGDEVRRTLIRRHASIGANATILPGVVIGRGAVVEPGAVVRENVPANAIVSGNPARIVSYVDSDHAAPVEVAARPSGLGGVTETRVPGVTLHALTNARDLRGSLVAADFAELPFVPRRLFTVYDVPTEFVRGAHAHKECAQLLVCLVGKVSCLVDDGSAREEIQLETPEIGLHIPQMIWGTQWKYTRDAVLLVLASHAYDPDDYIRDYEEFLANLPHGA